jgi:hypothetical protein
MPRPRSYSFDHFRAPERLPTERMDITRKPALKGATHKGKKKGVPPSELETLHYGMEHAETMMLAQAQRPISGQAPVEGRRVAKSPTSRPAVAKQRGEKTIARAQAAARRKVSRAAGKSPARKGVKKR